MKSLYQYITEAIGKNILNQQNKKFFTDIEETYKRLSDSKTLNPIKVNVKELNKPTVPFMLKDFRDKSVYDIIKNNTYGFQLSKSAIVNTENYIGYDNVDDTRIFPYFYKDDKNTYFIGLISFTPSPTHIDNYLNIGIIETSKLVQNNDEVIAAIYNDLKNYVKTNATDNCLGFASKPTETIYINNIKKTTMKTSDLNPEIYVDKF